MATAFYVYEHRRLDTGAVFYVGKGSGARLRVTQHRNPHWRRVAGKAGWKAAVVFRTDDEELAFLAEQELIEKHRRMGSPLTNMTDGGEGMAGHKFSPEVIARRAAAQRGQRRPGVSAKLRGIQKTAEHREKLAAARRGMKASAETRARMSAARKGRPSPMLGKRHTDEARQKISAALSGDNNPFYGRTHSNETLQRLSAAHLGCRHSDETRRLMSESRRGENNPRFGVSIPAEQKARQIASLKSRPLLGCPHCGTMTNEGNARRWHFDRCRSAT